MTEVLEKDIVKIDSLAGLKWENLQAQTEWQLSGNPENIIRIVYDLRENGYIHRFLSNRIFPKFYWASRDKDCYVAGMGVADLVDNQRFEQLSEGLAHIEQLTNKLPQLRYFGGCRFNSKTEIGSEWQVFGKYQFVIPLIELLKTEQNHKVAFNIKEREIAAAQKIISEFLNSGFQNQLSEHPVHLAVNQIRQQPALPGWQAEMDDLLKFMQTGHAQKVVLARKKTLTLADDLNPERIFNAMLNQQPNVYQFLFQPAEDLAFMGRTPERLFRIEQGSIKTEAIAGTRLRGKDEAEDLFLAKDLKSNHKDLEEHRRVSEMLESALAPFCREFNCVSRENVLQLKNVQHLKTEFIGHLQNGANIYELLHALHPTPAVGGVPLESAFQKIAELEKFDRGWYAGPVGWIGANGAEFSVAIRSLLIHQHVLHLFAGAGIMPDSDANAEWEEIENKMSAILDGLL